MSSVCIGPCFNRQIAAGGPVIVTHPEMKRYFMTIPEAVHLALQAGALGEGAEIYVLQMGQPIRSLNLAKTLLSIAPKAAKSDHLSEASSTGVAVGWS